MGSSDVVEPSDQRLRLERNPSAIWRRLLDGVLILAPDDPEPIRITSPGDLLWLLLVNPVTVDELIEILAGHFGIPQSQVRTDVEPVLARLLDLEAIRAASPTSLLSD